MRTLIFSLLFLVLCASGCAHKGLSGSYYSAELPKDTVPALIAADAVTYLAALYPPGHTTLQILPAAGKAENQFAVALESGLRAEGFTLLPARSEPATEQGYVSVAYTLDTLEKDSAYYLQLRFSDGKAISRAYAATGQPEAGRSSTAHVFKRPLIDRAAAKTKRAYNSAVDALDALTE